VAESLAGTPVTIPNIVARDLCRRCAAVHDCELPIPTTGECEAFESREKQNPPTHRDCPCRRAHSCPDRPDLCLFGGMCMSPCDKRDYRAALATALAPWACDMNSKGVS